VSSQPVGLRVTYKSVEFFRTLIRLTRQDSRQARRLRRFATDGKPLVSVVLGTFNRIDFLPLTVETVRSELKGVTHEIIVVDGGSTDGTTSWLLDQRDIISIVQHNRGEWRGRQLERRSWGYFMNLGFKLASGKFVCMVSDDCLVLPGAIADGVELFEARLGEGQRIGAVAFYWRNWPEEENYRLGMTFGNRMFVNHGLYLRSAMQEVGFADEEAFFFYQADTDLCLRMSEIGYACIESPTSFVEHYKHTDSGIRTSNMAKRGDDWRSFTTRWEWLGKPDAKWIHRPFVDPDRMADTHWPKHGHS
jgi:glycosyltransferase involved in cell wall biosynthesis